MCVLHRKKNERENENRPNGSANAFYISSVYIRNGITMYPRRPEPQGQKEIENVREQINFVPKKAKAFIIFETLRR